MEMTRCPECSGPAEVVDRTVLESTDGPVERAHVRCVERHRFWLPVAHLTREPRQRPHRDRPHRESPHRDSPHGDSPAGATPPAGTGDPDLLRRR